MPQHQMGNTGVRLYKATPAAHFGRMFSELNVSRGLCDVESYRYYWEELDKFTGARFDPVRDTQLDDTPGGSIYEGEAEVLRHDAEQVRSVLANYPTPQEVEEECARRQASLDEETVRGHAGEQAPTFIHARPEYGQLWTPRIGAGTIIPGGPGSEFAQIRSREPLHGAGVATNLSFGWGNLVCGCRFFPFGRRPFFTDDFSPVIPTSFSWQFRYFRGSGNVSASEPNGGRPTGMVFLQPVGGITGVNLGRTGLNTSIDSSMEQFESLFLWNWMAARGFLGSTYDTPWWINFTFGFHMAFSRTLHNVLQTSPTFPTTINTATRLETNDYFFGSRLGLEFNLRRDRWHFMLGGHFTPGLNHAHGSARQDANCVPCGALPDQFSLSRDDSYTDFAWRAGVEGMAAYYLTDRLLVGFRGRYDHYNGFGAFQNPTSPSQQPARLTSEDGGAFYLGAFLRLYFGPPPGEPVH